MTTLPPTIETPPRGPFLGGPGGLPAPQWLIWFEKVMQRIGGPTGIPIIGDLAGFETTVDQADLASGGTVTLLNAKAAEQWKIREIMISGDGTDFSGGNRDIDVTDGSSTWTVIPNAQLGTLAAHRWGDTEVPYPVTVADFFAASAAGANIVAQYSGGVSDHTAGSCSLFLLAERVA